MMQQENLQVLLRIFWHILKIAWIARILRLRLFLLIRLRLLLMRWKKGTWTVYSPFIWVLLMQIRGRYVWQIRLWKQRWMLYYAFLMSGHSLKAVSLHLPLMKEWWILKPSLWISIPKPKGILMLDLKNVIRQWLMERRTVYLSATIEYFPLKKL